MDKLARSSPGYLPRFLLLLALVFVSLLLVSWRMIQAPRESNAIVHEEELIRDAPDLIKALKSGIRQGGLQRLHIKGVEVLLEIPEDPKGVLFVAHGCHHAATDFWAKGLRCEDCLGLPEELNITARALARHYAVVGISSTNRRTGCWDVGNPMEPGSKDMENVFTVMKELNVSDALKGLPQYALGASSGGSFVMVMALYYPFAGIGVQIAALPPELLIPSPDLPYPPTAFIHMPRDQGTASVVEKDVEKLKAMGVPVVEIKVRASPVTAEYLSLKLQSSLNGELMHGGGTKSEALYKALKPHVLDQSNMLATDPRSGAWLDAVRGIHSTVLENMNLQADKSPLAEILNVAYAQHEIVSDTTDEMLDWFEEVAREAAAKAKREAARNLKASGTSRKVGGHIHAVEMQNEEQLEGKERTESGNANGPRRVLLQQER